MFCPECGSEYREGFYTCADCEVALVWKLPDEPETLPESELVEVYFTKDPALTPVIESLLNGAEIRFLAKGVGYGRIHKGANAVSGPVEFYVREDQAEAARGLLLDFDPAGFATAEPSKEPSE